MLSLNRGGIAMRKYLITLSILVIFAGVCLAQGGLRQRMAKVVRAEGEVEVMLKNEGIWKPA